MDPVKDGIHSSNGREWSVADMIAAAEHLPSVLLKVELLIACNSDLQVNEGLFAEQVQAPAQSFKERAESTNLSYPLLVDEEGNVLDGAHRLAKAKWAGLPRVLAKVLDLNKVPLRTAP